MGINSTDTAYAFGQLGSGFSDEAVEVTPPTGKVIVAIQVLNAAVKFSALVAANYLSFEDGSTTKYLFTAVFQFDFSSY